MKNFFLLFLLLSFTFLAPAQKRDRYNIPSSASYKNPNRISNITTTEICGNNEDDDNNGLIDSDDFSCFFNPFNKSCLQSKIMWGVAGNSLYWANIETGEAKEVGVLGDKTMYDITWAPDGKLYGVDANDEGIWEIDPNTASIRFKGSLPGYYPGNSLTTDPDGNLYLDAYTENDFYILKINIATWQTTVVANWTGANFNSGGDLVYLNGVLYLTGDQHDIAKIDVATGTFQIFPLINSPIYEIRGITSIGDGYLYFSAIDKLYRLDPVTMVVDANPQYSFLFPDFDLLGLTNYTETCKVTACTSKVSISNNNTPPYCTSPGIKLIAKGTDISAESIYAWTTPVGETIFSDTLIAKTPGQYFLKYYTIDGDCTATDSVILQFDDACTCNPFLPLANLGADKGICIYDTLTITNLEHRESFHYSWQDGSSGKNLIVKKAGWYWVDVSTNCGVKRDSVFIIQKTDGCEQKIFFPNAFTPNADGKNDKYRPIVNGNLKSYELMIYNRWGEIVFRTQELGKSWDGKVKKVQDKTSAFVWVCRYQFDGQEEKNQKGTVIVIR